MEETEKMNKRKGDIEKYFTEKYLKHSCFDTLEELLEDKTLVQVNAPRALIATELIGAWKGLNDNYKTIITLEEVLKFMSSDECMGYWDTYNFIEQQLKEARK